MAVVESQHSMLDSLYLRDLLSDRQHAYVFVSASVLLLFVGAVFASRFFEVKSGDGQRSLFSSYMRFAYVNFFKPHTGDHERNQQGALESFYNAQADIYDITRKRLLSGREEMLALVAAQLKFQLGKAPAEKPSQKPIWVDIGGGTGWNIETMSAYVDVPNFFSAIYLVDLSPSLCNVARQRFERLGWQNVKVICQDACKFNLGNDKADVVTMSYSLSMIPSFHVAVDSIASLLKPKGGFLAVVDFYVQSIVETSGRNYIGSSLTRHVNWLGRTFWRAWFDLDRVGLEGARRDYLEYRFGTLKAVDQRNYLLGTKLRLCIPYYIFLGKLVSSTEEDLIERLDAACTESPYLSPRQHRLDKAAPLRTSLRSKSYDSATVNLSARLPLPSTFYQNHHHRIVYDENLRKHTQFKNEFIYAFTWEDSRVDLRLLKMDQTDTVLCITSAGDNLLDYIVSASPKRVHAVDLNPNQNHLLELKVAAYQALTYEEFWQIFGDGRCPNFQDVLVQKLSPYMSSHAFQFWMSKTTILTSSRGLYEQGGSGRAIQLARTLFWLCGMKGTVEKFYSAKTLNEQRELWPKIRSVLMHRVFHWMFLGSSFFWKAAGVPPAQMAMIFEDHMNRKDLNPLQVGILGSEGEAMWQFLENTFDPVVQESLLSEDNHYYLMPLLGNYTRRCHPSYLDAKAHVKLSRPGAFDALRIHTDEIYEVIRRITPGSLTIAIVMDSMDWFSPSSTEAPVQIRALNNVLAMNGRVFLRSAGLSPWYIKLFENLGFSAKRVGARLPGTCIDRVNMYASTWIMTKIEELPTNDAPELTI